MEEFRKKNELKRRVLVVDDEIINREILRNIISQDYEVYTAEDGEQALAMLSNSHMNFSLCLLDLLMPKMDGFELLERLKENEKLRRIPIIVLTSEKDAEVKAIHMGAADFITKPYIPEVVIARLERIIELSEGQRIISSTERDHLTNLYTKDFFFTYIRQIEEYQSETAIDAVVLNVDHFNLINECYGRKTGEEVLKNTARLIPEVFNDAIEIVCRAEDSVFYIYCKHHDNYEELSAKLQDLLSKQENSPKVRVSLGVYQNVETSVDVETRYDRARTASKQVEGDYTNQIYYYNDELHKKSIYEERLIGDFDESIANKYFKVFYQPKYDISGDEPRLCSAEALIRWNHPELGMISPGEFVPLFERNGLIQKLDRFVWEEAAAQIKTWKETYGKSIPVSVNVSRIDIYDLKLEERLQSLLGNNGLTANELLLEITESAYADDAKRLVEMVNNLRERGFRIEMDDFGSGYSSLNMLASIPVDILKLDMKFVQNMLKDEKSLKLVKLIMDIAGFLNIPVVAEGVEEENQIKLLKEMGCRIIQGYYFSKPVPPEEFVKFIERETERGN